MRAALEAMSLRKMAGDWRNERLEAEREDEAKRAEIRAIIAKATAGSKSSGEGARQRQRLDARWVEHYGQSLSFKGAAVSPSRVRATAQMRPRPAPADQPALLDKPATREVKTTVLGTLVMQPPEKAPLRTPVVARATDRALSPPRKPRPSTAAPALALRTGTPIRRPRPRPGTAQQHRRPTSAAVVAATAGRRRPGTAGGGLTVHRREGPVGLTRARSDTAVDLSVHRSRPTSAAAVQRLSVPSPFRRAPSPGPGPGPGPGPSPLLSRRPANRPGSAPATARTRVSTRKMQNLIAPGGVAPLGYDHPTSQRQRAEAEAERRALEKTMAKEKERVEAQMREQMQREEEKRHLEELEKQKQAEHRRQQEQQNSEIQQQVNQGGDGGTTPVLRRPAIQGIAFAATLGTRSREKAKQKEEEEEEEEAAAEEGRLQEQRKPIKRNPNLCYVPLTLPARFKSPFAPETPEEDEVEEAPRANVTQQRRNAVASQEHVAQLIAARYLDNQSQEQGALESRREVVYRAGVKRAGAAGRELPETEILPKAERDVFFGQPALKTFFKAAQTQQKALVEGRDLYEEEDKALPPALQQFLKLMLEARLVPEPLVLRKRLQNPDLVLDHFGIGDTLGEALAACLSALPFMETLSLVENRFTDLGLAAILRAAVNMVLRKVDLSQNVVGPNSMTHLAAGLEMTGTLHTLALKNVRMRDKHFEVIADALVSNTTITDLDLSQNELGSDAGLVLGRLLGATTTLTKLNLCWNRLGGEGAQAIADGIRFHRSLVHLDLGWNAFGEDAVWLAEAMEECQTLTYLDFSRNKVSSSDAMVLAGVLQNNRTLSTLVLSGNPIGAKARRALLRSLDWLHCSELTVDLSHCSHDEDEPNILFDSMHPAGTYELDMEDPHERWAVSSILEVAANKFECQLKKLIWCYGAGGLSGPRRTVDLRPIPVADYEAAPGQRIPNVMAEPGSSTAWAVPETGVVVITIAYSRHRPHPSEAEDGVAMLRITSALRDSSDDDLAKLEQLREYTADLRFYAQHLYHLVSPFVSVRTRMQGLALLIPLVVNPEQVRPMILALSDAEQLHLKALLGPVFNFDMRNATNHYVLDLSERYGRVIAVWLLEYCNEQKKEDMRLRPEGNTSQTGSWSHFRNATLNGESVEIDDAMFERPPKHGVLEFDFVSTRRPGVYNNAPLEPDEFGRFLSWVTLRTTSALDSHSHRRLRDQDRPAVRELTQEFRVWISGKYFVSEQVAVMMHALYPRQQPDAPPRPDIEEQKTHRLGGVHGWRALQRHIALMATLTPERQACSTYVAASFVVALYEHILDLENFSWVMQAMPLQVRNEVIRRLGILNLISPLSLDGRYDLDLGQADQRGAARLLLELSNAEPGTNLFNESFNGHKNFVIPRSWSLATGTGGTGLPNSGQLQLAFFSGPGYGCYPKWDLREKLLERVLPSIREGAEVTQGSPWLRVYGWPAPQVNAEAIARGASRISFQRPATMDLRGVAADATPKPQVPNPPLSDAHAAARRLASASPHTVSVSQTPPAASRSTTSPVLRSPTVSRSVGMSPVAGRRGQLMVKQNSLRTGLSPKPSPRGAPTVSVDGVRTAAGSPVGSPKTAPRTPPAALVDEIVLD